MSRRAVGDAEQGRSGRAGAAALPDRAAPAPPTPSHSASHTADVASPATDRDPPPGMVRIPGGAFRMGSDRHYAEERPAHEASVDGFWMDEAAVTNAAFVGRTGYATVAERPLDPALYPG